MNKLEAAFEQAILDPAELKKLGYNPTYFIRMVHEHGGVETAHRLLAKEDPSAGLTTLWELGRLDLSLEAIVLKPEFAPLFSAEERQRVRQRLAEHHGYTAPWDQGE